MPDHAYITYFRVSVPEKSESWISVNFSFFSDKYRRKIPLTLLNIFLYFLLIFQVKKLPAFVQGVPEREFYLPEPKVIFLLILLEIKFEKYLKNWYLFLR